MENIPAVANNKPLVNNAEFVKLTIYNEYGNTANNNVYTFSSSYQEETIDGLIYSPLGGLLAVGVQQRDIRATSADTSVSLSGIDGNNMAIVLGSLIRGSKLEITRGFYNNNYIIIIISMTLQLAATMIGALQVVKQIRLLERKFHSLRTSPCSASINTTLLHTR